MDRPESQAAPQSTHRSAATGGRSAFVTTHWSVVLTAGRNDTARAHDALANLCQTYWHPLYAYVRRRGYSPEDAQDLTQEFFARLLGRNWIGSADRVTPEQVFERRWALTLLDEVLKRLQAEYERDGKSELFAELHPCLIGERTAQPYAKLAEKLNATEGTIKALVHRLRQRYRQLLREEIAQTVATADEVDEELRHLFAALAG